MFSALKRLFGRSPAPEPEPLLSVLPHPETADSDAGGVAQSELPPLPNPESMPIGLDPLQVPYAAIVQQVPREYCGKLAPAGCAGCNFTIPKASVLEQLPRGAVKVTIGELKRGVPYGVFAESHEHDQQWVDLPLSYILRQLNPEDYAPKPVRQAVEVPDEIGDVFDAQGKPSAQVQAQEKNETPPAPAAQPAPPRPPAPPSAPPPGTPPVPSATRPMQAGPGPTPSFNFAPTIPVQPEAPAAAMPSAPLPPAMPPPSPAPSSLRAQTFLIALEEIAVGWPDAIRAEISQLKVPFAKCALPSPEICEGLKRGKLQYNWGSLRSRILPIPSQSLPSPNADTVLDLPLNVVTPLFLDFIRSTSSGQPVDSNHVTEFFRKGGKIEAPPPPPVVAEVATPMPAASVIPPTAAEPVAPSTANPASPANVPSPVTQAAPPPVVQATVPPPPQAAAPAVPSIPPPDVAPAVPAPTTGSDTEHTPKIIEAKGVLSLPLNLVLGAWPEPVQKEIAQHGSHGLAH